MTRWVLGAVTLTLACGDDRTPTQRGSMPTTSATTSGFYARPAITSAELTDAALWRCTAVPLDEAPVGHPPPGASAALHRRRFELRECAQLRGASAAAPRALIGFTMLAPAQRHDDPAAPALTLDGQRFFDAAAASGPVLLWIGGPAAIPPMGFEGNQASVDGGAAAVRPLALAGADAALADGWRALAGWSAALPAPDAHPLVTLDALRVALARGDADAAATLRARLDADDQPPAVRAAARDALVERPTK